MPVITQTIRPGERRSEVTAIQKGLIDLGAYIDSNERAQPNSEGIYGPTTQAGLLSLRQCFPPRMSESELVDFNASDGRLLNIALGAELGNTAKLQVAVRESFAAIDIAPAAEEIELSWLARYATIARDFITARKIIERMPNRFPLIESIVKPQTLQTAEAELLNPENYYTFFYEYVSRKAIKALVRPSVKS